MTTPTLRRRRALPAGVFSACLAALAMTACLVAGWHIYAGAVVAVPVLLDRRPPEWQQFGTASGLLAVCAAVTQAQGLDGTSLVFLAAAALCGLAAVGFGNRTGPSPDRVTPPEDSAADSGEGG